MVRLAEVVHIADRFAYCPAETAIQDNNLKRILGVLLIVYVAIAIAIVQMAILEKKHPHIMPADTNIAFELEAPPPPPPPELAPPKPEDTPNIDKSNGGAKPASAAKALRPPNEQAPNVDQTKNIKAAPDTTKAAESNPDKVEAAKNLLATLPAQSTAANPSKENTENSNKTSGTNAAGGNPNGTGTGAADSNGTGGNGTGTAGNGTGDGAAGNGSPDKGTSEAPKKGNIAPYRREMLIRISQNWHPKKKAESLILLVTLSHDGSVLACKVEASAGNQNSDDEAVSAITSTAFAPLPDWYQGDHLQFRISMDKVERLQNN